MGYNFFLKEFASVYAKMYLSSLICDTVNHPEYDYVFI